MRVRNREKRIFMINLRELEEQSRRAVLEICEVSGIKEGQIFVVGCSSSEVIGSRIGWWGSAANI